MAKFCNMLLVGLLVGFAVADGKWEVFSHQDVDASVLLMRSALGLLVCFGLFRLGQLVQKTGLAVAAPLRWLGAGIVLLQAFEHFGLHGYFSVLGGTLTAVGAVRLLVSLHKSLRV